MVDKDKAFKFLNKNFIANINIIDPLVRGTAEIVRVSENAVLAYEKKGELYLISSETEEEGIILLEGIEKIELINVCRKAPLEYIMKKFNLNICVECYQCAYLKGKEVVINTDIKIELAKKEELSFIAETYKRETPEGIREIWERGEMFCGYKDGKMTGFAGVHLEGSVGLLHIFPEYREKGYGAALEAHVINHLVRQGRIPYGHVVMGNELSLKIQRKIGFQFSEENMYWVFSRDESECN